MRGVQKKPKSRSFAVREARMIGFLYIGTFRGKRAGSDRMRQKTARYVGRFGWFCRSLSKRCDGPELKKLVSYGTL